MSALQIHILQGADARARLAAPEFVQRWNELARACPWATSAQTPAFARAWYEAYRREPLLVVGERAGDPCAVLALTQARALAHAGLGQAEYQSWVCAPADAAQFACDAFGALAQRFGVPVHLKYLPRGMPLEALDALRTRASLEAYRRPIIDLADAGHLDAALTKGRNRERLRQFERVGKLRLERLDAAPAFDALLETMAPWCDSRQIAVHGHAAFAFDPGKMPFYKAMFRAGDLLHAVALYAGDTLAAVNIGGIAREEVQLGVIAHNPWLARHSPGMFLIRMLAQQIAAEGYHRLDLTAGGDGYKERYANAWDEVHSLTVYRSRPARGMGASFAALDRAATAGLARIHVTRRDARLAIDKVRTTRPSDAPEILRRLFVARAGVLYERANDAIARDPRVRRDALEDLLAYDRSLPWSTRQEFLALALRRIEAGQHVHTIVADGRLVACGWTIARMTAHLRETAFPELPAEVEGKALIHACHVVPQARRMGLARALIATIAADAPGARVFAHVPRRSSAADRLLTGLGFVRTVAAARG